MLSLQLTFVLTFNSGNINGAIFFLQISLKYITFYVGEPFRCADKGEYRHLNITFL